MPLPTDAASAQWIEQLTAMRNAVEALKSGIINDDALGDRYGRDVMEWSEADLSPSDSDELWDPLSENETSDDERFMSSLSNTGLAQALSVSADGVAPRHWLRTSCERIASRGSGLDALALEQQVIAALESHHSNDELQMVLADTVGLSELDFVIDTIRLRKEILSGQDTLVLSKTERSEQALRRDQEHKTAKLAAGQDRQATQYPHVYCTSEARNTLSAQGSKYALPVGTERYAKEKYEEYSIPASKVGVLGEGQQLVQIKEMDWLCSRTFTGYATLNRMQSLVYPVAYHTSENMLICAPTGAGKTDAALLTILNIVAKHLNPSPTEDSIGSEFVVDSGEFKIVYVAPMKALAAEITQKLGQRLAWLGLQVRELTGDMQLTKAEILRTQIIVTTPEKWDVVTRKSTGDTELVQKVRLLIIDEVHMLHDERGAVLESLAARTQRQVESTQSLIRIVGLSATLPNYLDVADFLKVNRMAGLFYFDQSFRPVPLEQHFIGVKGKPGSRTGRDSLDNTAFEKVKSMLEQGHQVMVFVHSRKDTVKTARLLHEKALEDGIGDLLDPSTHSGYTQAIRQVNHSRGREIRELVAKGMGTHHAGMPRSDRNLIEQLFASGVLKVLCCTATLAWGVNLPAAAVIIKGTQLYSAEAGKFVDLGILDVLQIFGRAGRPQFQDTGIGMIITTHDKLQHYLSAVTQQQPIESQFSKKLVDNLNAEIALGTVTSLSEAITWLGYSFLFVRMRRNPIAYGIDWAELIDDPNLVQRRRELVLNAARVLQASQMIIFNETTEELRAKDVGRIASQFYVLQTSIEIFNTMMRPHATEADVLKMISMSGEFDNIQSRESEEKELTWLKDDVAKCEIDGGIGTKQGKTNVLLQSYISKANLEDFTLVSDTAYVAQNAARICRALFMIALNRRWGYQCLVLSSLCKSIEKRVWSFEHPFRQFDLPQAVLRNLDQAGSTASVDSLRDMEASEIGSLVHNQKIGGVLAKLLEQFPTVSIDVETAPLNRDVLRVKLYIIPDFRWNDKYHGKSESYWIWVEDSNTSEIYHHEFFILSRKRLYNDHELHFTIPLSDPLPSQIYVRAVSDRWLGAETVQAVSFQHLIRPDTESVYTPLLNLQPLPVTALRNPILEGIYGRRFQYFNPMQTQLFYCMYHTPANVLLGSPTGSGKTIAAELAMWWAFREQPGSKVVYIAPMKALVRERVQDWSQRLVRETGLKLVELTGDNTPETKMIRTADIIVTTPEKWDGISRSWQTRNYVQQVSLVIIDEIHLLGGDRGPILEIIVSRMNYIASRRKGSVRLVGMSTACANATDLANWLGVKNGLFNFRHSVRPVPLEIFIDGFPEQRGFCPLMQSMNRPTFLAIKSHSPDKPAIVFVASRRQTRLTAMDLINFCGMEDNPKRFLRMSEDDLSLNLQRVKDESLREALSFGIGLHHAGLVESDRQLAEELFANNKIQILVATSTLAWGVNLPAHLVVVKGTQFFDAKIEGYKDMDLTDVLQMLGRAGRPQFDTSGIARIFTQNSKKEFYKHFLHTGFPVESSLHKVLDDHFAAEISAGTIVNKQDALDYLTWTFFYRRLHKNPSYYGLEIAAEDNDTSAAERAASQYIVEKVDHAMSELAISGCITLHSNGDVDATAMGKIMSYYYLSHKTVRLLVKSAHPQAQFGDVLMWICRATEYDELPVRHNEDLINSELSANLPLKAEFLELPLWDPHVKAFLLLQAHFSHVDFPVSDYVGDQTSVLDQSIRIIQAGIDILAELGYLATCRLMMTLLQCVKSARWPDDGPLSIFPQVGENAEKQRVTAGQTPMSLIEASRCSVDELNAVLGKLKVPQSTFKTVHKLLGQLPQLRCSVSNVTALGFCVHLTRLNQIQGRDHRIYAPRFPKSQSEGFFVIVSDANTGELLILKRSHWTAPEPGRDRPASELSAKSVVKLPESTSERRLRVIAVSDSYLAMEWEVGEVKVPGPPRVDDDAGSKKVVS